ncbi:ATP-binding protein [Ekhidna sp.]|uniref:ATP-binding protein n=1 Tax=Ekhidna sp. TaxID=2608089 RepID=UPI003B5069A0
MDKRKRSKAISELKLDKLFLSILIAFIVGVLSVLLTIGYSNRKAEDLAFLNTQLYHLLEICEKQRTLSQYLTKNALLLEDQERDQELAVKRLDSALLLFNDNHSYLSHLNERLNARHDLDVFSADSLFNEITPILAALVRSSYGIQEAENIENFKAKILLHEKSFLPLMTTLRGEYQEKIKSVNERLEATVIDQYWMLGLSVIVAASLVFLFTSQVVRDRIKKNRKSFEAQFREKDRYERLINSTHEIIYELDADGKYKYVNPAFTKLTGYSLESANQRAWIDHIPKSNRKEVLELYTQLIKNRETSCYKEFPITISSGEERWIAQSTDFKYDDEGNLSRIYNIVRDITDEYFSSIKQNQYKEGLRLLNELNSKSNLTIQERLEDGLKLCCDYLCLEVGIISKIWMDEYQVIAYYPGDCGLSINQKFKLGDTYCDITLNQKGKVLGIDEMSRSNHKGHPCFEKFQLETYIGSAYRIDGKVTGTVNFTSSKKRPEPFTDYEIDFISLVAKWVGSLMELQENQTKLIEEQNLLKTFVASAPAAMAMFDKHMTYISASEKWLKDQNIEGNVIGKSHYKVFPEIPQKWKRLHKRALEGEVIKPGIEKFERADGSVQWLKGEIHPWYTSKEKVGGIIIFINDLTEIKRQEVELRKAKEEAEAAGKIKAQFLSTMSHEIRTPLNAIIGTTNLLEMEHPELAESSRLKMLKFGSNNLLTLINDILDFQKIESGNLDIVETEVNLHELCDNIIETWKTVPSANKVDLSLAFSQKLGDYYTCDEIRLVQVLNNLLSNALKFTYEGRVELMVSPTKGGSIHFEVKDTGIGIPADKVATIFESFKQINNQESLRKGGTGLGLSISKKLVEMMGGELSVKSQLNKGTTFFFDLPLQALKDYIPVSEKAIPDEANLSINVLLVEDNLANQEIAKSFLSRWGAKVAVANNGEEAVEMIQSKGYDLMLIDVRMPVMNGYEATNAIRNMQDEYFHKLPIIALTASTLTESRAKMQECGMNEIVSKPFDPSDLFEKVNRLCNKAITIDQKGDKYEKLQFKFLSEILGDDEEKIKEIANMTVLSIEEDVKGSLEASQLQDRDKAHDHLHKIKSHLAHLDLQEISSRVPNYKDAHFWKDLPSYLEEVKGNIDRVKEIL